MGVELPNLYHTRPSGALEDREAIAQAISQNPNLEELIRAELEVVDGVTFWRKVLVEDIGFYPKEFRGKKLSETPIGGERFRDQYKPIIAEGEPLIYKLVAQREIPQVRLVMDEVALAIMRAREINKRIITTNAEESEQQEFRERFLGIYQEELETGEFAQGQMKRLEIKKHPNLDLFVALCDRYDDTDDGLRFSPNAWQFWKNVKSTDILTNLVREALGDNPLKDKIRIFVGYALAYGGLSAKMGGWSGNAQPSEESIRRKSGSDCYISLKNFIYRLNKEFRGAAAELAPWMLNWSDEEVEGAFMRNLAMHEGCGHTLHTTGDIDQKRLGPHVVMANELGSELKGQHSMLRIRRDIMSEERIRLTMAASLVWRKLDVDNFLKEEDIDKKAKMKPYAEMGAILLNGLEQERGIIIRDNGEFEIPSLSKFEEANIKIQNRMKVVAGYDSAEERDRALKEMMSQPKDYQLF